MKSAQHAVKLNASRRIARYRVSTSGQGTKMPIGLRNLSPATRAALRVTAVLWTFGYILVIVLSATQQRGGAEITDELVNVGYWAVAMGLSAGVYALWRRTEAWPPVARWPVMVLTSFAAAIVLTLVDTGFYHWLAYTLFPQWRDWATWTLLRAGGVLILYTWTFFLNLTLFWALSLSEQAREEGRRAADAEAATQRAQLAALRLQLNPHFLFNTLNAISTLVMERDCERADRMIERLSEFLRASLSTDPDALMTLGEELDTIQAYLEIESVRFEGRLNVEFHCVEALRGAQVPGFILQPLVENAMKYAVAPAMRPVTVAISAETAGADLVLRVADDGRIADPSISLSGTGVGLANTRARLSSLYGERGVLSAGRMAEGYLAEVRLPLTHSPTIKRVQEGAAA